MTHRYSQRNQHDLLYEVARAYPGGIEALAQRLGTTAKKLYKKLSPKSKERNTTAEEFSLIMEMCAGAGVKNALSPLEAQCWRHGGVFISLDDLDATSDESIQNAIVQLTAKLGTVAGRVTDALECGELTENEMEYIEPEMRGLGAAFAKLCARVKGRFKRDASKPRRFAFRKAQRQVLEEVC